jgi:hypothetical protein
VIGFHHVSAHLLREAMFAVVADPYLIGLWYWRL